MLQLANIEKKDAALQNLRKALKEYQEASDYNVTMLCSFVSFDYANAKDTEKNETIGFKQTAVFMFGHRDDLFIEAKEMVSLAISEANKENFVKIEF